MIAKTIAASVSPSASSWKCSTLRCSRRSVATLSPDIRDEVPARAPQIASPRLNSSPEFRLPLGFDNRALSDWLIRLPVSRGSSAVSC